MNEEFAISPHRIRGIAMRLLRQWKVIVLSLSLMLVLLLTAYMLMRQRKTYLYRSVLVYTGRQMQGAAPAQSFRTALASAKSIQRFRNIKQKFGIGTSIRSLSRQFVVKPTGRNHLIEVIYKSREQKNATKILSYFVHDYAKSTRNFFLKHLQSREKSYKRNLQGHRRKLAALQKSLKQLQSNTGYLGSEYSLKPFLEEKSAAAMAFYRNDLRMQRLTTELKKLRYFLKRMRKSRVMRVEKRNPLRGRWLALSAKISGLSKTYTRRHPTMRGLLAQRKALRRQMNPRTLRSLWVRTVGVNRVRQKIEVRKLLLVAERAALRKQMPTLKARMKKYQDSFHNLPGISKRYRQLLSALQQTQGAISVLSTSHVRIAAEAKARRVLIDVVDPPGFFSTSSMTKRRALFALLGLFGAFVVFMLCLARALFDDVIRYPFELKEFNACLLGEAPLQHRNLDSLWNLRFFMQNKQRALVVPLEPKDRALLPSAQIESMFLQTPIFDTELPVIANSLAISFPLFEGERLQNQRFEHMYQEYDGKVFWVVLAQTRRSFLKKAVASMDVEQPPALLYTHAPQT